MIIKIMDKFLKKIMIHKVLIEIKIMMNKTLTKIKVMIMMNNGRDDDNDK